MSKTPVGPTDDVPADGRDRVVRRRLPAEQRRQDIVRRARTVFARQGLSATGMRDIAAAAGLSVGTITYHFTGLEEILAAVLQRETDEVYTSQIVTPARARANGRDQLDALVDAFLSGTSQMREHWYLWMDFWSLSARHDRYARWQSEIYGDWWDELTHAFERGAADGSLVPADARTCATEFMALLDGLVVQAYLPAAVLTPQRARGILHDYVASRATG